MGDIRMPDERIYAIFRAWRARARLTRPKLGKIAGVSVSTLENCEGKQVGSLPGEKVLQNLVRAYMHSEHIAPEQRVPRNECKVLWELVREQKMAGRLFGTSYHGIPPFDEVFPETSPRNESSTEAEKAKQTPSSALAGVRQLSDLHDDAHPSAQLRHMPPPRPPLIGRDEELARVERLFMVDNVPLITLTGPGGSGKTLLARHIAARAVNVFVDDAYVVPLDTVPSGTLMLPTVARVLGIPEGDDQLLEIRLCESIRQRRLLIVLDNFEHVLDAAGIVQRMLAACPHLKILVTSREPLHVWGVEHQVQVESLRLPRETRMLTETNLMEYPAVALFVARAKEVKYDFALTTTNAAAVVTICRRLDGLPLAIELAAARIKDRITADGLLTLLEKAPLLSSKRAQGAGADAVARSQSMYATVAWSYSLLDATEQALFRRLSLLTGGCSLTASMPLQANGHVTGGFASDLLRRPAAEAVCGAAGLLHCDLEEGLGSLVDKSLIYVVEQPLGEPRYLMLETIRAYGRKQLELSEDLPETRRAFLRYFLALAERAEPDLRMQHLGEWLAHLDSEYENLRAALRLAVESNENETALRLASALGQFWQIRGYFKEGRSWLTTALAQGHVVSASVRAIALKMAGTLALFQNDYSTAQRYFEESRDTYRELNNKEGIAACLNHLGLTAERQGIFPSARKHQEESLRLRRDLADEVGIADCLDNLGALEERVGNYLDARVHQEESLKIRRTRGDMRGIAACLNNLGIVAKRQGDVAATAGRDQESKEFYRSARAYYGDSLGIRRTLGFARGVAACLHNLGCVAQREAGYAGARKLHEESLTIRREFGDRGGIADCLDQLAIIAAYEQRWRQVARYCVLSNTLRAQTNPRTPVDEVEVAMIIAETRVKTGASVWDEMSMTLSTMKEDEALGYVISHGQGEA